MNRRYTKFHIRNVTIAVLLAALSGAFGLTPLWAEDEVKEELKSIYLEPDAVDRLEKYDALAEALFEEEGATIPERAGDAEDRGSSGSGRWIVNVDTDPMSDETVVFFALPASSGRSRYGDPPLLAIRRSGSSDNVYIIWNDYLADEPQMVEYRIDDGSTRRSGWSLSTDNQATFYPDDDREFIRELVKADRFVARTTPYNESPVTAVFDLSGLKGLVEEHGEHVGDWAE